jgi:hypothetical protein
VSYLSSGDRYGRWLVLEDARKSTDTVLCRCDCGTERMRLALGVKKITNSRSCGCLKSELTAKRNGSHGLTGHPLYGTWLHMIHRCTRPDRPSWPDYGGRGIRVCDRWLGDAGIANFIADMGPKPTTLHSLDRLDNDGDYEPGNCAWTTQREQSRNTRPKIRLSVYAAVLADIERLREQVRDLGGDPGIPFQTPAVIARRRGV